MLHLYDVCVLCVCVLCVCVVCVCVCSELLLMGGDSAKSQMQQLSEGVDIVCGTPGRIDDLVSSGKLDLSGVSLQKTWDC